MAVFGDVMAVFGDVMAVLWRCYGGVMAVFGEIMAGPGCYGGVRRCLWRDLDDALKDELYRIRGRGPPPDDPPSFNSRS